ncbi:glycoside hydrolase family 16 protein [Tenacibaculum sp. IB213877]|uniref:glycoside hydrolase family 16 protein n=1 Tax=Tenacibaculum sp. IB213877 TaxID=3097351 RepID=UPI002A5AF8E6|nr:glycoside hydrolase family 16 protein [Tenacibaculum sp. IB213877]MDY0779516.1 glycoside hydrolase family 16 protein [Tenacibaculum sp. IB213877]
MKKSIYSLIILIITASFIKSCQKNDYEVGDIVVPKNVSITAEVLGVDENNPHGDGSGFVVFKATADNEINFQFDFGDGKREVAPSGVIKHRYTKVGINTFSVIVNATGTGGVGSSSSIEVTVYSSFSDVEAESFLTGAQTTVEDGELVIDQNQLPSFKKWYWQADKSLHVGLGPVEGDGFDFEAWWSGIGPWDEEKACMYDNEFVFTRTAEGVTFEQTVGPAFVPGTYAGKIGVDGDQCHDETVAINMFGVKDVTITPSESTAALEGQYNGSPYRQTSFEISDGGFMGWYVGASTYDIISITNDELIVRIVESGNDFAWYHKFTSTKPSQDADYTYDNLVWEDDFNTDGAPDASKWTYDIGTGDNGWGNSEVQYYTDRAENAKVEGGNLVITAKREDFSGSQYTSARLKTEGLYDFQYGRVEIRAQLPQSAGTWPALWMLGSNYTTVGWPDSGEIDIMEQTGSNKTSTSSTLHYPGNSGGNGPTTSTTVNTSTTEFHTYTVEWKPEEIIFAVDDQVFFTFTNEASLPFNQNFFLIFNVAMGGTLGGTIDSSFTEDSMLVDYVKVYQ